MVADWTIAIQAECSSWAFMVAADHNSW